MGIGSYKEAERYRMRTNKNLTRGFYLDTRRTLDEEPFAWEQPQVASIEQPGAVQGFADGGLVKLPDGRYQYRAYRSGKQTKRIFDTKKEAVEFQKQFETENPKKPNIIEIQGTKEELLKDMHSKTRYNIKLAQKKGIIIESSDKIDVFLDLLEKTAKKDKFRTHPNNYYRKMWEVLGKEKALKLFLAKYQDVKYDIYDWKFWVNK